MTSHENNAPRTEEAQAPPVPDPYWLSARRTGIRSEADLDSFSTELGQLTDDLTTKPGGTVAGAVGWTVIAVILAFIVMLVGVFLINMGSAMVESFNG
jgi:hypothetical protein